MPTVLYALFWLWYTPLSGPMTQSEIDEAVAALEQGGADPEAVTRIRNFFESDDGEPFIMVNIIDLADDPAELPATGPDASADDLMAALEKTIAFPVSPQLLLGDPRLILFLAMTTLLCLIDMIFLRKRY